jgi:hypothetical protein
LSMRGSIECLGRSLWQVLLRWVPNGQRARS